MLFMDKQTPASVGRVFLHFTSWDIPTSMGAAYFPIDSITVLFPDLGAFSFHIYRYFLVFLQEEVGLKVRSAKKHRRET